MPYLNPSEQPQYSGQIPAHTTSTVVHPDSYHPVYQALLDNTAYLKGQTDTLPGMRERLDSMESTSAVDVNRAVRLDWQYRGYPYAIEFFSTTHTLLAHWGVPVIQGVQGDDSLDVENVDGIRMGADYILASQDGNRSELVRVRSVLSGQRVRLFSELASNWGAVDKLGGMSLRRVSSVGAQGVAGSQWASRPINLGNSIGTRAVVIRRTLNAGEVRLFYRDVYTAEWLPAMWSLRRAGSALGDIPMGMADYEYLIPMRGDGYLRLVIEGEESIDITHIVGLGGPTGLGGYLNQDLRPAPAVLAYPLSAAVNVVETPTLQASGYSSPASNAFATARFQISGTVDFGELMHESPAVSSMGYSVPAGIIPVSTTVYWRAVVTDSAGLTSDPSEPRAFTTKANYAYVKTPALTAPLPGQTEAPEQPTLQCAPFAVQGGVDTHAQSRWQIQAMGGDWTAPVLDEVSGSALLAFQVPANVLAQDTQYEVRMLQVGAGLGASEWSAGGTFTTKAQYANVLGIVLLQPGNKTGQWQRIDGQFNPILTNITTFASHPTYAGIVDQSIDGQAMVRIPRFFVKTGTVPGGAMAGKRFWMISDRALEGFAIHPAFMSAGSAVAQVWVGKYQGTADGAKLGSAGGLLPKIGANNSAQFSEIKASAAARNTGGVSGFSLWSIYHLAAIQVLALIETGGSDSKTLIGRGVAAQNSTLLATDNALVALATWRGLVGLWGNYRQAIDGIQVDGASKYKIWDKNGHKTFVTTDQTIPPQGYQVTLSTNAGAIHDLGMVFLPETTAINEYGGTMADSCSAYANADVAAHGGGGPYGGSNTGLFEMTIHGAGFNWGIAGRLAKV